MVKTRVGAGGRWGYIRGWYGGLSPGELFPGGVSPRIILEGLVEGIDDTNGIVYLLRVL